MFATSRSRSPSSGAVPSRREPVSLIGSSPCRMRAASSGPYPLASVLDGFQSGNRALLGPRRTVRAVIPSRDLTIRGYVVGQTPNGPMLVAVGAAAAQGLARDEGRRRLARAVHLAAFAWWAALELTGGVNLFRRALGAAGLLVVGARVRDEGL